MGSSSDSSTLASIGASLGLPSQALAEAPANIRNGNSQAQEAYAEGLAFEQVLVNQLTTQLANTMGSGGLGASSGLDGSTDGGDSQLDGDGGLLGGSSASAYSSLIPQALTSSIMSDGGLGLAEEFAQAIDPSLNDPTTTDAGAAAAGTDTSAT